MTVSEGTELSVKGEGLQQLYTDYIQNRFLINRRYQRKLVWAVEEKQRLIDSALKKLPIPLILLAESQYEGSARLEVIDGLQRLDAIFSFIENKYPVDGRYFDLETLADTKFFADSGTLEQKTPSGTGQLAETLPTITCLSRRTVRLASHPLMRFSEGSILPVGT